jgi:acetyltransferase
MVDELFARTGPAHVDQAALAGVVAVLGALVVAVPELDEIEINPLRATVDGPLMALDVIVGSSKDSPAALAAVTDGQGGF